MYKNKNIFIKVFALIAYFAMVFVNYLANALPINNVSTGQASDSYPNLFTPAGITFSIWGLIYLLLAGYVFYQFGFFKKDISVEREKLLNNINRYFILTSIANICWIFAWHYGMIGLSVVIMLTFLVFLIKIADILNKEKFSWVDNLLIKAPFSVYFGWITVATIANITVLFVSINWNGFGLPSYIWAIVILLVGALIGIARMLKDKNIFYGLVLVWAYFGIWLKHTSIDGYAGEYSNIINTIFICIFSFLITIAFLSYQKFKLKNIKVIN
jgi:hypothetical protein